MHSVFPGKKLLKFLTLFACVSAVFKFISQYHCQAFSHYKGQFTHKWKFVFICSPSGHSIFFFFSGAVNIFSWNRGPWWNQLPTFENKQSISRNTKWILIYRDDILRSYTAKWSVCAINWRLYTTLLTVIQSHRQTFQSDVVTVYGGARNEETMNFS